MVSNCCGAPFHEPGWPDSDICSTCHEHCDAVDDDAEEPPAPAEREFSAAQVEIIARLREDVDV